MRVHEIKTPTLRLAYEESGPKKGEPLLLVHGWPDSPRAWDAVLPALHEAGYRTIAPYLRGFGPTVYRTRFWGRKPRHTGQVVALAQDAIDLLDGLDLRTVHYIGHDWGANAGYAVAALFPQRLKSLITLSVAFRPPSREVPAYPQSAAYWYQWLQCTEPGAKKFREDPLAFCKAQWDSWGPERWYSQHDLAEAARSWEQGDAFVDTVLHYYRTRWGHADPDPNYAVLQDRFAATTSLSTPTLLIQGMEDRCTLAETTDGLGRYFTGGYSRVLVDDAGHFPHREQPKFVAQSILEHIRKQGS